MMLSEIKHYLRIHQRVTLSELAIHFGTEPEAMRGMLQQWIHKGKVVKFNTANGCSGNCPMCSCSDGLEIYEWCI